MITVQHSYFHQQDRGFTLVELIVTLMIVGLLAAIALPMYAEHVERAQITTAIRDIGEISSELERHFSLTFSYPSSLAEIGEDRLDPWDNPYEYLSIQSAKGKGKLRKNKNLVPVNSDFDLYSKGKDGASASPLTAKPSRDDIVRANNGGFIGKASDY